GRLLHGQPCLEQLTPRRVRELRTTAQHDPQAGHAGPTGLRILVPGREGPDVLGRDVRRMPRRRFALREGPSEVPYELVAGAEGLRALHSAAGTRALGQPPDQPVPYGLRHRQVGTVEPDGPPGALLVKQHHRTRHPARQPFGRSPAGRRKRRPPPAPHRDAPAATTGPTTDPP